MEDINNIFTGIDSANPVGAISGNIGTDTNPSFFSNGLRELTSRGIRPKIVINSGGGSIFGGMEIIDSMMDGNVDTHIAGMAASMAGVISQFGKHRTANDFAMLMIHPVSGTKDKGLEEKMNSIIRNMLTSRSKMTPEMIDDFFKKGKDVWFDSSQMLELGLIDEIINTTIKVENFNSSLEMSNLCEIFNSAVNSLTPDIKTENKNMDNDFKGVKNQLGLDSSDTERDIINSIKAKDTAISDLKTEVEINNEKIGELENTIASMNQSKITELITNAVEAGKITAESKAGFEKFAKTDFDGAKKAIEGIKAATVVNSIVDSLTDKVVETTDEALLKRGYDNILNTTPEILEDLLDKKPDLFNQLIDERTKK